MSGERGERATERRVRVRVLVAEYRTALIAGALVLVVLGAWLSYGAYGAAPETTEERTVETWSVTGEFHHSAEVTESTTLYPAGTVLEDRPRYFTAVSPTASGEYVVSYDAPDGTADIDVSITRIIRAADGETVFWEEATSIASTNATAVEPGESVAVDLEVAVADAVERIDEIQADLGATAGDPELLLDVRLSVDGTVAGFQRSTVEHHRITTTVEDGTYAFEDVRFREPYRDREAVPVERSSGSLRSIGGPSLLLIGLGAIGGLRLAGRRLRCPTDAEREWLAYRSDRDEYADLVTTASLPPAIGDRPRASVDSLAELAQLAIDLRAALHYDPIEGTYLVVADELIYRFEPPTPPRERRSRERDPATGGDDGGAGLVLRNAARSPDAGGEDGGGSDANAGHDVDGGEDPTVQTGSE